MRYMILLNSILLFGVFAYLKHVDVQLHQNNQYYWVFILAAVSLGLCYCLIDVVRKVFKNKFTSMNKSFATMLMFVVMSVSCFSIHAQAKLSWADFKGTPDSKSPFEAFTKWTVYYAYDAPVLEGTVAKIKFRVNCTLDASSWAKRSDFAATIKDRLLNHEQGHYTLGQICALDIRKRMNQFSYDAKKYKAQADSIFKTAMKEYIALEKKYDNETNHMNNQKSQKEWDLWLTKKYSELSN